MTPYYNQNNGMLMISYVIPMYYGERFIGVVGMDFDYVVLSEQVHSIKVYENGFAYLESNGTVIHYDDCELDIEQDTDSKKYLKMETDLVNGMTLVLSASYDDIREIRYSISVEILVVSLVLFALFTLVVVVVVEKIVNPLKKITDASVKLSNGDYNLEPVKSSTREILLLSDAFVEMAKSMREREEILQLSANRDALTGLRNTTSFKDLAEDFDEDIASGTAEFGVAMLDLNYLKETNDKYGHSVGNELLVAAAKVISDVFKRSPVFRIGGDEFLTVLQGKDLGDHTRLFEQFEQKCSNAFIKVGDDVIPIRVAIGFAKFDAETDSHFSDVFDRADEAMYEKKREMKGEEE